MHTRLVINGFTFMGRARVPPKIVGIALTDRGTGTVYWLKSAANGTDFVGIETPLPSNFTGDTFPAFQGPQFAAVVDGVLQYVMLLIRDGFLGYETLDDGRDMTMRPIFLKPTEESDPVVDQILEIKKPAGAFSDGDGLAYERRTSF